MAREIDDTKYSLMEHLTELRARLLKSMLAVALTTSVTLWFSSELLDYSIRPLDRVLHDKGRVETLLVHRDAPAAEAMGAQLEKMETVRYLGRVSSIQEVAAKAKAGLENKRPIDLIIVEADAVGSDGALVSDLLEGIEPQPSVAYLVKSVNDPAVNELQLEGATVLLDPPREPVLKRVLRRAGAAAGKSFQGEKLVVLSPLDPFFAYLKVGLIAGIFLACPAWLYQLWRFIAPGLYLRERKVVAPTVISASLLFLAGGAFAYFIMFPIMFDVLVNQMMPASLAGTFTVDNYLSILIGMTLAFGVVFETPLILALLAAVGIVSATSLRKFRKYAIILAFVIGAVLTPADPISQTLMSIPLVIFYELGIIGAAIFGKKPAQKSEEVETGVPNTHMPG